MRRKLIVGNWKMNGGLTTNAVLLDGLRAGLGNIDCDVAVCVPAPYFAQCRDALAGSDIAWGGQDLSIHDSGAYTGEISGWMLRDFDCRYVIVGHSERRACHAESSEFVARKAERALCCDLTPIVCVGETLEDRDLGRTEAVIADQIDAVLAVVGDADLTRLVLAYEPVWAIGTGKTATPEMAQQVHALLRARVARRSELAAAQLRILYGGSMKPGNASQLLEMPDIDGGLIGGAALQATDFLSIAYAACGLTKN